VQSIENIIENFTQIYKNWNFMSNEIKKKKYIFVLFVNLSAEMFIHKSLRLAGMFTKERCGSSFGVGRQEILKSQNGPKNVYC
jgi:hypothetical protein